MTKILGEITVPGDKSISHRSIMLASIASGSSKIKGFLYGADCISTMNCFKKMGIDIDLSNEFIVVHGKGMRGLKESADILDCGNSGTTTRLISGILAAQSFNSVLSGDASIQRRPMDRIITPLKAMGADIMGTNTSYVPLYINGRTLNGINYISNVASAQVKSCVLLAALYADSPSKYTEPKLSRNHTELMLKQFGAEIKSEDNTIDIKPTENLYACDIQIPGDISSAAFFIAAASICEGSELLIKNVGINPSRDGFLRVAKQMGADIEILNIRGESEKYADILVKYAKLKAFTIEGDIIPLLIDEIPILAAMASLAEGTSIIRDAAELKVKESNRIKAMVTELSKLGVDITQTDDGMIIRGSSKIFSATVNSYKDHRIAMTFAVLGLVSDGSIEILDKDCVDISYPDFYSDLRKLCV